MCPPAPFSGETPPALVRWGLAWKIWSRMTQTIGNETEAMVTMVSGNDMLDNVFFIFTIDSDIS